MIDWNFTMETCYGGIDEVILLSLLDEFRSLRTVYTGRHREKTSRGDKPWGVMRIPQVLGTFGIVSPYNFSFVKNEIDLMHLPSAPSLMPPHLGHTPALLSSAINIRRRQLYEGSNHGASTVDVALQDNDVGFYFYPFKGPSWVWVGVSPSSSRRLGPMSKKRSSTFFFSLWTNDIIVYFKRVSEWVS